MKLSKIPKSVVQVVLVIAILAGGVALFKKLASMRKPPAKKDSAKVAPLLNAFIAEAGNARMFVAGFGTVAARLRVQIAPEVSGRIVSADENFVNGGFFRKGQTLVAIDARDYELAVQNAEAAVAQAKVVLDKETAEARVAKQEWLELNSNDQPASPLVLREPQIAQATAGLKAAEAQLARAKLNLQRTKISLPFNGRVVSTSANLGQFVNPGQQIATVYGTDVVEISVPVEDSQLEWINVPGPDSSNGTTAEVFADFAGSRHKWNGTVIRTGGHIDPSSRMVDVIIEVKEPFNTSNGRPPLTPGMFVDARIKGKVLQNVIRLPRHTIHNGSFVWLDRDGRLSIQKVTIARFNSDYAYITDGIADGDTVITSPLDTVTDGMLIRSNLIVPQEKPNE